MEAISDVFVRGVWGPYAKLPNDLNYGGPECAAEAPNEFKYITMAVLVSHFSTFYYQSCWALGTILVYRNEIRSTHQV